MNKKKIIAVLTGVPFLGALGAFVLYLLFGYLAVDPLARRALPWVGENMLASRIAVREVKFDPLSLELTVSDFRLSRPDGAVLAGFGQLYVDLQADSLFRLAWHLRDIRITRPEINLEVGKDGKLNWAEVIAKLSQDKKPSSTMPRVVIDSLKIDGGRVQYAELNRAEPFRTGLAPLSLQLGRFSTLPEDRGDYLVAAELAGLGGRLRWKGDLGVNPLASAGAVELQGLKLAGLLALARQPDLPLTLSGGELGLRFGYDFAMVAGKRQPYPQLRLSQVGVDVKDVAGALGPRTTLALQSLATTVPAVDVSIDGKASVHIRPFDAGASGLQLRHEGQPLFTLARVQVTGIDVRPDERRLAVAAVALEQGAVRATRNRDGTLDWLQLVPAAGKPRAGAPEGAADVAGKSAARDPGPFRYEIGEFRLDGWKLALEDRTFMQPLQAKVDRVDARLQLGDAGDGLRIGGLDVKLAALSLQAAGQAQPAAQLARVALSGGEVAVGERRVRAAALDLSGLQTKVVVNPDKSLDWAALLRPAVAAPAAKPAAAPARAQDGATWKLALDRLRLDKLGVHVEDRSLLQPVAVDLQDALVELRGVSLDQARPVALTARLPLRQGGRLDVKGKASLQPARGDLQLKLAGLQLKPYSPYLSQFVMANLTKGQAELDGRLSFSAAKEFSARFNGGFRVSELAIAKESDGSEFLSWDALSSDSLTLSLAPNRLHMGELRIGHPIARLVIFEDRTINLQQLLRAPPAAQPAPAPAPARPQAAGAKAAPADFQFAIERVRVADGDLEFADLSLRPQFGAHIHYLDGVINGLSGDPASTAQVELDGKVDDYGSARVRGTLQPFRATDFTDLKVEFRNLEMNRLTPYSGKFAGRKIDSGKLTVDLEYKLKNRQLVGENKVVIDKIRLGERVDSRDAMSLPLDLAIAILEDSNGVIDIDLPIKGSLDDPQFSYGKIIWKAVVNVLQKVVTAPFRAIGKLLGISADKLEAVSFDPGSATLAPPELEKLKSVATALVGRPALTLQVAPSYDAAADKAALQEMATRRDVAAELGLKLKPGEPVGPLDLSNVKVQTAISNLLKDRSGEKRSLKMIDSVKDYFRESKPEDLQKYGELLERLKATVKIGDAELAALAGARAAAIRGNLVETGGLAAERVSIGEPAKVSGDGKSVALKLTLGARRGP